MASWYFPALKAWLPFSLTFSALLTTSSSSRGSGSGSVGEAFVGEGDPDVGGVGIEELGPALGDVASVLQVMKRGENRRKESEMYVVLEIVIHRNEISHTRWQNR